MASKAAVSVLSILLFCAILVPVASMAGVNVNLNINAPLPPIMLPGQPPLLPIPGAYAYFAPDASVDIFFYHGYWYRPHEGRWYRSSDYNGPWRHLARERVPGAVVGIPHDYRSRPRAHQPVPYGEVKKNWGAWERDRHWDKQEHERGHDNVDRGGQERGDHDRGGGRGHEKRKYRD